MCRTTDDTRSAEKIVFPRGFGQFADPPASWSLEKDASLTVLAPTTDGIKRVKITPDSTDAIAALASAPEPK
jgi:hypothetical protein